MSYSFTDRAGDEQDGIERAEARAEERLREQRWSEFVEKMRLFIARFGLSLTLHRVSVVCRDGGHGWEDINAAINDFAAAEGGWDAVLNALARAIRELKADAAQVLERR